MLRSVKELSGFAIHATDGDIGSVDDIYFEENSWMIRYVVVDTGHWLPGRRVLLAPVAIGRPDWANRKLPVSLTRQKVRESPDVSTTLPIMRQQELELHQHYLWEPYWIPGFTGIMGGGLGPIGIPFTDEDEEEEQEKQTEESAASAQPQAPNLRSADEIMDYDVEATDGAIGHVEDFLFDEMEWSLRWVLIDTGVWIPGRKVLIPISWIDRIMMADETVHLALPRDLIASSPSTDPARPLDPQLEEQLYSHYRKAA
jgi:uncharacterized protein YrrD